MTPPPGAVAHPRPPARVPRDPGLSYFPPPRRGRGPAWLRRLGRPWLVAALAGVVAVFCVLPWTLARIVRTVTLPRLGQRLGGTLAADDVTVRPGRVTLRGLRLSLPGAADLLRAARVEVGFATLPLLLGRVRLHEVVIDGAAVQWRRGEGEDPLQALRERLHQGRSAGGGRSEGALSTLERVRVVQASLDIHEPWGSARATAEGTLTPGQAAQVVLTDVLADLGHISGRAARVAINLPLPPGHLMPGEALPQVSIEGGAVAPWPSLALTGIAGTVQPDAADPGRAVLEFEGGYGGVARTLWQASGWVRPGRAPLGEADDKDKARPETAGEIALRAKRFQLSSLDPILKDTPIIESQQAQVDASLDVRYDHHALDFNGSFNVAGLSIFSPRLVAEPVRDLGVGLDARGHVDFRTRRFRLERAAVRWRGAEADLEVEGEAQPANLQKINLPAFPNAPPQQAGEGPGWRERWRTISAHLSIPPISCQRALESIPPELVPHLQGFKLGGTFSTDLRVNVDFAELLRLPPPPPLPSEDGDDPDPQPAPAAADPQPAVAPAPHKPGRRHHRSRKVQNLPLLRQAGGKGVMLADQDPEAVVAAAPAAPSRHEARGRDKGKGEKGPTPVTLSGKVGIDGCKVLEAPPDMDAQNLMESFEHSVEVEPGKVISFTIGPENPDYVPYEQISPYLINSIMTTEDNGFMRHRGFIAPEFRSALEQNLQRGYFRLGASSITMQMVKNVILSREKTLSRKLQEMFLTWYLEQNLTKERILEIYFNAIEFGPYLYGIGKAARHYFGKSPLELTPREAAWFSSILPNPKRRYVHFCKGQPDAKWEAYLNRILRRVHERGRLTDEEFAASMEERFTFNREEALPERECLALIKRLTEAQPQLQPTAAVDLRAGSTPAPRGESAPP